MDIWEEIIDCAPHKTLHSLSLVSYGLRELCIPRMFEVVKLKPKPQLQKPTLVYDSANSHKIFISAIRKHSSVDQSFQNLLSASIKTLNISSMTTLTTDENSSEDLPVLTSMDISALGFLDLRTLRQLEHFVCDRYTILLSDLLQSLHSPIVKLTLNYCNMSRLRTAQNAIQNHVISSSLTSLNVMLDCDQLHHFRRPEALDNGAYLQLFCALPRLKHLCPCVQCWP